MLDGQLHGDAAAPGNASSAAGNGALIPRPALQLASKAGVWPCVNGFVRDLVVGSSVLQKAHDMPCTANADGAGEVLSAADYLHSRRTYQGLVDTEPAGEATPVVSIKQGRTGRAAQYEEEGTS
jgi:hypothetical protein